MSRLLGSDGPVNLSRLSALTGNSTGLDLSAPVAKSTHLIGSGGQVDQSRFLGYGIQSTHLDYSAVAAKSTRLDFSALTA